MRTQSSFRCFMFISVNCSFWSCPYGLWMWPNHSTDENSDGDITYSNNYRGITLSPVISKVFELVLMEMVGGKLTSSPLQFGFI